MDRAEAVTSPTLDRRLTLEAARITASRAFFRARAHGYSGENFTVTEWLMLSCGGRYRKCGEADPIVDHVIPQILAAPTP